MRRRVVTVSIFIVLTGALGALAATIPPITDAVVVRQVKGTEFTTPYLGRTLLATPGETVSQSFAAPKDGVMTGIGLFSPIPNGLAQGPVTLTLWRLRDRRKSLVYRHVDEISSWANNEGLSVFKLGGVRVKKGDHFLIHLASRAKPGVMVFNSKHDVYKGGNAAFNGRQADIDIAFQVFYAGNLKTLWARLSGHSPNLIGPAGLFLLLIGLWLTAALFLSQLWVLPAGPLDSGE